MLYRLDHHSSFAAVLALHGTEVDIITSAKPRPLLRSPNNRLKSTWLCVAFGAHRGRARPVGPLSAAKIGNRPIDDTVETAWRSGFPNPLPQTAPPPARNLSHTFASKQDNLLQRTVTLTYRRLKMPDLCRNHKPEGAE
jgi:hypothetical protein